MLPPYIEPPYRVVLSNEEEAVVLAGEQYLAQFTGGWETPIGHANACFFAKAANCYGSLVRATEAARDYLSGVSPPSPSSIQLRRQLEHALDLAAQEPHLTHWSELERRRSELRLALADFLGKPVSQMPPISTEQDKMLGELESIETLIGPE